MNADMTTESDARIGVGVDRSAVSDGASGARRYADTRIESDYADGVGADTRTESEPPGGARRYADPFRFDCAETAALRRLVMTWRDLQGIRKAFQQREADPEQVKELKRMEDRASRQVAKGLRAHPIWPWLAPLSGLAGPSTALVMSAIGNPHRFPGQLCTAGHYLPVGVCDAGEPCPLVLADDPAECDRLLGEDSSFGAAHGHESEEIIGADSRREGENASGANLPGAVEEKRASDFGPGCPGIVLPPRPGTGVRSVWHLLGLHAIDLADGTSVSPRRQKGFQCDWHPLARAMLLMPDVGLAAQIVKHRPDPYRGIYDAQKERLPLDHPNLRPIAIDRLAQKIAVKAFVGDLFTTWKAITE